MIYKIKPRILLLSCIFIFVSCDKKAENEKNEPLRTCPLYQNSVQNLFDNQLFKTIDPSLSKFLSVKLQPLLLNKKFDRSNDTQPKLVERDYSQNGIFDFASSKSVDLGMGQVPVLDQGAYGTCVTFATTAAIDAILGLGNYISQQCSLMLDLTLGHNYWDGAYEASQIITPLQRYGVVSQAKCPYQYPSRYESITLEEYGELADNHAFTKDNTDIKKGASLENINHRYYNKITLDIVREALKKGHRILLGFGVMSGADVTSIGGFNTKINCQNTTGGLWACKQPGSSVDYCSVMSAGHEAIVIGFDDSQELLKIRNSWGPIVGDSGNFYMTYAFFEAMKIDGTEIY